MNVTDITTAILVVARLLLAAVFGVAGTAKLADIAGSRRALIGFGVDGRLAGPLGLALPVVELLVALTMLAPWPAQAGAAAALVLLLVFAGALGWNLMQGRTPDCNCFGQIGTQRASWTAVVRNVLLAAVAGFVAVADRDRPGTSPLAWLMDLRPLELVNLVGVVAALGLLTTAVVLLRRMLRQQATVLERIGALTAALEREFDLAPVAGKSVEAPREGLPLRAVAPEFSLPAADGSRVTLADLRREEKAVLLVFVSPSCLSCKVLFSSMRNWNESLSDRLTILVLTRGTAEANQAAFARYAIPRLVFQGDSGVGDAYQAAWTPAAVLVGADGRIASQTVYGDDAIRRFVADLTAEELAELTGGSAAHAPALDVPIRSSAFRIGEPAPRFSLPDVAGRTIGSDDLLGSPTLLVFWHTRCGFCQALLPELGRWIAEREASAPKPILIATGERDEVERLADALGVPVLYDGVFDVPTTFGSRLTPSAILLDAEGRIASGLALGARNVLALVGARSHAPALPIELASPGS